MISVSLDVSAVPPQPVGAGRYTIDVACALARRDDVGLVLWARRDDEARWRGALAAGEAHRLRAVAPRRRPERLVWEQLRLPSLLTRTGADVHHGPHYTMPERARLPMVVTVHDLTFLDHPEWHERTKVPLFRRAIRRAAMRADALVSVSEHTARQLEERLSPRGRVFVVPHGVDHDRFRPDEPAAGHDEQVLAALGLRAPFVLFLGTIEPRKAVPELVAAFARTAGADPAVRLVLAGRPGWGAAGEEVERAVARCGLTERVVRTGYVPDAAVPALLRRAAVVAYPAHEEGFGLPALEALACGTPLVTTTGTAMAELAGTAAILVEAGRVDALADAIAEAITGGPAAAERRRLGLAVAAAHTWDRSAAGHVEAYLWARDHWQAAGNRSGGR